MMQDLKVFRTEEAREFDLIHVKKQGDVGYDLPSIVQEHIGIHQADGFALGIMPSPSMDTMPYFWLPKKQMVNIPTGIFVRMPMGYYGRLECRSSTNQKLMISGDSIIDEGYTGELIACIANLSDKKIMIKHGDRLVQLVIHKKCTPNIIEVNCHDNLGITQRNCSGFGSTGN